jgi:hypothetical protein
VWILKQEYRCKSLCLNSSWIWWRFFGWSGIWVCVNIQCFRDCMYLCQVGLLWGVMQLPIVFIPTVSFWSLVALFKSGQVGNSGLSQLISHFTVPSCLTWCGMPLLSLPSVAYLWLYFGRLCWYRVFLT